MSNLAATIAAVVRGFDALHGRGAFAREAAVIVASAIALALTSGGIILIGETFQ